MAIFEGKWRCTTCQKVNLGRDLTCGCGSPRESDEQLFLDENAPAVTDPGLLAKAKGGANWFCGYCRSENVSGDGSCAKCGGSRDRKDGVRKDETIEAGQEGEPPPGPRTATHAAAVDSEPTTRPSGSSGYGIAIGCVAGAVGLIGLLLYLFLWSTDVSATVTETSWKRTIRIEQLGDREEGWDQPGDAKLLHTEQRVRIVDVPTRVTKTRKATKEVPTGQTKTVKTGRKIPTGNGFYEEEEKEVPIMKTVVYDEPYDVTVNVPTPTPSTWYVYRRWKAAKPVELVGETEPIWPAVQLAAEQRRATDHEEFTVILTTGAGKSYTHHPKNEEEFRQFTKGATKRIAVTPAGTLRRVE